MIQRSIESTVARHRMARNYQKSGRPKATVDRLDGLAGQDHRASEAKLPAELRASARVAPAPEHRKRFIAGRLSRRRRSP
jgi:hypothetical protein